MLYCDIVLLKCTCVLVCVSIMPTIHKATFVAGDRQHNRLRMKNVFYILQIAGK